MRESLWGVVIIVFATISILLIYFFQNVTNTDQQNYTLLKETAESAMYDAIDKDAYSQGIVRIDAEKFTENFIRRFAESANLSKTYVIEIYDINEYPPKVSLLVKSTESTSATGEIMDFDISNKVDMIVEKLN